MAGPSKDEVVNEIKGILAKVVDDVGRASTFRQLIIGGASGWLTGFTLIKVGKASAAAIGSGILLLQIANHNGYIKINWDKVAKKAEKVSDKIEENASKSNVIQKVGKFVDEKLDKAETILKKKERKVKKWFNTAVDEDYFMFEEIHVFMATFLAGILLGMICGIICR